MFALAPLLAVAISTGAPPAGSRIDALAEIALKAWDVPGAALLIVSSEGVVHLKGYGVRELNGKPVTADTVFPLASCSKSFTTTLMAILADDGKLSWDDPVRKHLPEFRLSDAAADSMVTLRDLASHRTGVGGHDLLWYRAAWPQEELIRRVGKLPLSRPFRTEMQYQTVMYIAAGQAAAKAGGKSWGELIENRLLKPLEMKGVFLTTVAAKKHADCASGYRDGQDGKLETVPWYPQPEPNPAGSVHATARGLAPYLRLHLTGGKLGDDRIVSEANLRETHTPQIVVRMRDAARSLNPETQQISYGLGWVIQDYRGKLLLMHAGMIDGFRAHFTILPKDGYAFAILANREGTRMNLALSNSLVDLLLGLPVKDWNKYLLDVQAEETAAAKVKARQEELNRRPDLAPSLTMERLAGVYEDDAYGSTTMKLSREGGLVWEWGPWKIPLEHYAADTFRLRADREPLKGTLVRFIVEDGEPKEIRVSGLTFRRKNK
jgi:CubicO group peptidase (beta-lactamase class C family)